MLKIIITGFTCKHEMTLSIPRRNSCRSESVVNAINATPRVALLPLVIIWLGIGILSKVGIVFLGAVFPLIINTRDGIKTTAANLLTRGTKLQRSEWQIFRSVVIPRQYRFILTGLRLAIGRTLIGVMV